MQRDELLAKTDSEVKLILENAEKEAKRIQDETDRQIMNIVASVLRGVRDRIIGGTELESRKSYMKIRQEVLQSIYKDVKDKLGTLANNKALYHNILIKLIVEGMKNIGGSDFIVSANDRDLAEIKKNKKNLESDIQKAYDAKISIKLDNTPIASIGGVIVSSTDGKRVYYNTFDGRISKIEIKMNTILAKQLEAL
jgi:vacuolar-type H+-ATPase subunit E/Vma4